MGNWHQDLVVKNASDEELDNIIDTVIEYLIKTKIISEKKADNVLRTELGHCPGEYWDFAVEDPEDDNFLTSLTNGLEIRKGRTVFYASGEDFESIACPNCNENNIDCDWGELFNQWLIDPESANLQCTKCSVSNSISDYLFEPKWALSNLGFVFWNWPMLKQSFVNELEKIINKKIERVEGKN